jgi:hypothetical protein
VDCEEISYGLGCVVGLVKGSGFEIFTKRGVLVWSLVLAWDRHILLDMYIRIGRSDDYQYGFVELRGNKEQTK